MFINPIQILINIMVDLVSTINYLLEDVLILRKLRIYSNPKEV